MYEFNKFRIITVGFILMFIFAIAAMYTNTKDITAQKLKKTSDYTNSKEYNLPSREFSNINNMDNNEFYDKLSSLSQHIEQLELNIHEIKDEISKKNNSGLDCQIRGILSDSDVIPLSSEDAIQEARLNDRQIVITCSIK